MKILHIITRLILGGAQQNTVLSCRAQVAGGHQVWLAYGPIYGPEGSLLDEATSSGAELIEVSTMRRAIMPLHDWRCYVALRRMIRRIQPDIVHTHSSKAGIVGRAAGWSEHVPGIVHTIHGLPFHDRQPAIVRRSYIGLERWAARRCHKLIGVTQAMGDAFAQHGIGRLEQFTVIPSGMDISSFDVPPGTRERVRRELGIAPEAPVLGIVARLDKLKGQDDLLDIMPRMIQAEPRLRLLIVGGGWHRAALQERVQRQGLVTHVIFTGLVSPARIPELLSAIDVKALPSYQEGQPRTMVQALLCGCAIVGYDAGGIGEVCIEGKTGRLVPVGDREQLAAAILELLHNPVQRRRLAEQGREYARQRFDSRMMVAAIQRVYEEVLGRKQS